MLLFQTKASRAASWWGPLSAPHVGTLPEAPEGAVLHGDSRRPNGNKKENNDHHQTGICLSAQAAFSNRNTLPSPIPAHFLRESLIFLPVWGSFKVSKVNEEPWPCQIVVREKQSPGALSMAGAEVSPWCPSGPQFPLFVGRS